MEIKLTGITFHVKSPQFAELREALTNMAIDVKTVLKKENQIMGKLEDVMVKIGELKPIVVNFNTLLDQMRVDVQAIKDELEALKSGEVLSAVVTEKINTIELMVNDLKTSIVETKEENFPSGEVPPIEA